MSSEPQVKDMTPQELTRRLEVLLGKTLAAQCLLDPEPDDLRGHVLAKLNVWVPAGAKVGAWVAQNHTGQAVATTRPKRIEVECTELGTESGRASYTCRYTASGTIGMTENELRELIREAGSREVAIDDFVQWADDNHEVDDYDHENYEYDDEEASDTESEECNHDARTVIVAYLDAHPELLAQDEAEEEGEDDCEEDEEPEPEPDLPMPF